MKFVRVFKLQFKDHTCNCVRRESLGTMRNVTTATNTRDTVIIMYMIVVHVDLMRTVFKELMLIIIIILTPRALKSCVLF